MASWRPWRLVLALGPGQSDSGKWRWHQNAARLGARYNYFAWDINSPILPLVRAAGLEVKDWQNLILVNQLGQRFYDETKGDYPNGNLYNEFNPYRSGDYRNNASIDYNPTHYNFFNAAVAMNAASGPPDYAAGPYGPSSMPRRWPGAVAVTPPYVDPEGYCFSGNTLAELAAAIKNPYQAYRWMVPPCKPQWSATIPLSTPVLIGISASLCPIKSGRGRSTPPGPHRWCTTRALVSGSTPGAR